MHKAIRAGLTTLAFVFAAALPAAAGPVPGDRLKPFSLLEPGGSTLNWTPGQVTVFSFCAFWCDTWKEQSKRLANAAKTLSGLPVDFLTISVDGRWSERGTGKIAGKVVMDTGGALRKALGIDRIPYTVVVDAGGVVRYASQGIVHAAVVEQMVRDSLAGGTAAAGGVVYLTFDDFPSAVEQKGPTSRKDLDDALLDVLRAEGVRATFFCIGSRVTQYEDVIRRAAQEGHSLQIHSWDHEVGDPQLDRCTRVLTQAAGAAPTLYRPPGSSRCMHIKGGGIQAPVANPYDYSRPGEREIARRVSLAVKPGSIILLHAGVSETIDALPEIICSLRNRGLEFDVLR